MVKIEFSPREERGMYALGIFSGFYGAAVRLPILAVDCTILFLPIIKVIEHWRDRINPVAIYQEERRKTALKLAYLFTVGKGKISWLKAVFVRSPMPEILNPGPGSVIDIDKILIIEMYGRKSLFDHEAPLTPVCFH